MVKSLGKCIKSTFFRKKKSQSLSTEPGVIPKSSCEKAFSTPQKEPLNSLVIQPSFISDPTIVIVAGGYEKNKLEPKCVEVTEPFTAESTLASSKQDNEERTITKSDIPNEFEKQMLEQSARRIQATFRCYRARREFDTLKSIIRLQSVIRGDLVRRCAVSSTTCSRSELEIAKCNSRVVLSQKVESTKGEELIEIDGGKHDLKPTSSYATDIPCWPEDDTEKQRRKQWKLPKSPLRLFSGLKIINPSESIRAMQGEPSFSFKEDKNIRFRVGDHPTSYLGNHDVTNAHDKQFSHMNENKYSEEDWIGNENQNRRNLRGSLPIKHGDQVMGRLGRKGQSCTTAIAPTNPKVKVQLSRRPGQDFARNSVMTRHFVEDAASNSFMTRRHSLPSSDNEKKNAPPPVQWLGTKVKVKRQASPRFGQHAAESNFMTRRYSLPSSDNEKPNASSPVPNPIQASGIGEQRLGKLLPSSRGKSIQPKWKP